MKRVSPNLGQGRGNSREAMRGGGDLVKNNLNLAAGNV